MSGAASHLYTRIDPHTNRTPAEEVNISFSLVRLQILAPISLFAALASNLICTFLVKPGVAEINDKYPTLFTPSKPWIGVYWILLYVLQIGFWFLVVLARKDETKDTLINGVGIRFAIVNVIMALWPIFWTLEQFLVASILILVNLVILITIYLTLNIPKRHRPTFKKPVDWLFIHAPMTLFLVSTLNVDAFQNGMIALGWLADTQANRDRWTWPAFGAVLGTNIIGAVIILFTRDAAWTLGGIWVLISLAISKPKPLPLFVAYILLSVLYLVSFVAGILWKGIKEKTNSLRDELDEERRALLDGQQQGR